MLCGREVPSRSSLCGVTAPGRNPRVVLVTLAEISTELWGACVMLGEFWGPRGSRNCFSPFSCPYRYSEVPPAAHAGFPADMGLHSQWHFQLEMGCVALVFANPKESGAGCELPKPKRDESCRVQGCELCRELPAL